MNINLLKFYKKTRVIFICLLVISCNSETNTQVAGETPPNILFIMTDDQSKRTVSAYDGAINQTPNIDRLAAEGAVFQHSFVANSICNPSRASILTGTHSHKNGVVGNASPWDNRQAVFPRLLQQNGYTTALIGKWHMNNPPADEFDYSNRLTGAGKQGFYYNPEFVTGDGDTTVVNGHSTDIVTDQAIQWLNEHSAEKSTPFMLMVQFKAPHVPRMAEFRFLDQYLNDTIPEPETLYDDYETRERYASEANMGFDYRPLPPLAEHDPSENIYFDRMTPGQLEEWHSYKDPEAERYHELQAAGELEGEAYRAFSYQMFIKNYLRLISGVDENVGKLLEWLDDHPDVNENTMVVFTSDQGFFTGEHGWAEKRFMYEQSLSMPLLIRWPGVVKPEMRIDDMVQNIDFAPTFLDVAGLEIPEEMQGESFKPLLEGGSPSDWRESIYYHYYDHGIHGVARHEGVRTERYKLIHFYTDDAWEFYDLENDPNEVNNLYRDENHQENIQNLKKELEKLRDTYEVPEKHLRPPYVKSGNDQEL